MERNGIAVAGNMIVDVLYPILGNPKPGELTTITEGISRSSGGALCNVILDLAKLDSALPLTALGRVGTDPEGDYVLDKLRVHPQIETAQVRLLAPTPQEQRLIGKLSEGVSARELPMVAKKCGLSATDQHSLLQRLAPVLVRVRGSTVSSRTAEVRRARHSAPRLHVIGEGTFAAELQRLFAREGGSSTLVPPGRPDEAAPSPPPRGRDG